MKGFLVDTHAWIWYVFNDPAIKKSFKLIDSAIQNNDLYISDISLWEIAKLDQKKRIILEMPCLEWINKFISSTSIKVISISSSIAVESCHLPEKFHSDPADEIIIATARVENLTILTRDKKILAYSKQKHVSARLV